MLSSPVDGMLIKRHRDLFIRKKGIIIVVIMALVAIVAVIVGGVGGSLKAKKVSTVTTSMVTTTLQLDGIDPTTTTSHGAVTTLSRPFSGGVAPYSTLTRP